MRVASARRGGGSRAALLALGFALSLPVAAAPSSPPVVAPAAPSFAAEVAAARARDPAAFARVASARRRLAEGAPGGRRAATTTLALRRQGAAEIWPLIAAVEAATAAPASGGTEVEVELGLVEALGASRDPRARPALAAWLGRHRGDPRRTRAGAAALGRLGDDAAVAALLDLAARAPEDLALLAGLGECRRLPVAEYLVQALAAGPDAERARVLARALRDVAAARVWQTPAVRASGEGDAVRALAVDALLAAAVAASPALRDELARALVAIDHPETAARLAAARSRVAPQLRTELDALADAMARLVRLVRR